MEHDIIAYLYPYNDKRERASTAIEENPRHAPPLLQPIEDRHSRRGHRGHRGRRDRRERESTEPPENPGASALDYLPNLVVRFGDAPRTDKGLIFGSNPKCDVFLDYQGISNFHFSLTFDEFNRPIVKDLNSLMGTQVTYDGGGEGARRDFQWIVGGHDIPQKMESIIIMVPDTISFQIVVPFHDIESPAYVDNVEWFKQGTATAEGLLDDMGLSNPSTRGTHTPGTGEIYLRKKLGEGSFGVVTHLWNVSTCDESVVKEPTARAIRRQKVNSRAWEQEALIMSGVSHPHIVRLLNWSLDPCRLHLEYVPGGSLDNYEDITYNETLTILQQCLSALAYLHGRERPIAHRDIKPDNILVQYRSDDIYVKLGDFGVSRDSSELVTMCGTSTYLAPEIYSDLQRSKSGQGRQGYTVAVDIWSLGVVAYELAYGLPQYKSRYEDDGVYWCEKLVRGLQRNVEKRPSGLGQFLLSSLMVLSPESRLSASECYNATVGLLRAEGGDWDAPTPCLHPGGTQQATLSHAEEDVAATVLWQPSSTSSYRFVRSGTPAPETFSPSQGGNYSLDQFDPHASTAPRIVSPSQGGNYSLDQFDPHASAAPRIVSPSQSGEYHDFMQSYSSRQFHALAAEMGGKEPDGWASQASRDSTQRVQATAAGAEEHGAGSGSSAGRTISRGAPQLGNDNPTTEGGDSTRPDEAALLLQAIAEGHRA